MPLVHFVLFKTTLPKENLLALHEDSLQKHQFTPSRVNDSSISHLIHTSISFSTLISFITFFFTSFIYISLYFASFCFLLLHFASFRLHFASFRLHFASFRILVGPYSYWGPQGLEFLTMLAPGAGPAK